MLRNRCAIVKIDENKLYCTQVLICTNVFFCGNLICTNVIMLSCISCEYLIQDIWFRRYWWKKVNKEKECRRVEMEANKIKRKDIPFFITYPFLEFEVVRGGDNLNWKVLRVHFYMFPNSRIWPYCKGNIWWINNSFLQVSGAQH